MCVKIIIELTTCFQHIKPPLEAHAVLLTHKEPIGVVAYPTLITTIPKSFHKDASIPDQKSLLSDLRS